MFGISTLNISDLIQRQQEKGKKHKKKNTKNQDKQIEGSFDFSDYTLMYAEFADDFFIERTREKIKKNRPKYNRIKRFEKQNH